MKKEKIKNQQRIKRKRRVRAKIFGTSEQPRLSVKRSNQHLHFQVIDDSQSRTLAAASTLELDSKKGVKSDLAAATGKLLAEKSVKAGISKMVLDRGYYKYHGRIKAAVEEIRKSGIKI